jgi:hypothetical protein
MASANASDLEAICEIEIGQRGVLLSWRGSKATESSGRGEYGAL